VLTEQPNAKISTLNPQFLQAARDEAARRNKDEQSEPQSDRLISASPRSEIQAQGNNAIESGKENFINRLELTEATLPVYPPKRAEVFTSEPDDNVVKVKADIAGKQAEITQIQQQLDRLIRIKEMVEPQMPIKGKADLNELRMKRLAIQMALVADSKEYEEKDLLAIDMQIAELAGSPIDQRHSATSADSLELIKLNAKIEDLQDRLLVLNGELSEMILDHNLQVAFMKANDYVRVLTEANSIRHDLLALAELLTDDAILINMKLGGELPIPAGFEPFDAIFTNDLSTTIEGVEKAKLRLSKCIVNKPEYAD